MKSAIECVIVCRTALAKRLTVRPTQANSSHVFNLDGVRYRLATYLAWGGWSSIELAWIWSSLTRAKFSPFLPLGQIEPSSFVIARWLRGRSQTIEWFPCELAPLGSTADASFEFVTWHKLGVPFGQGLAADSKSKRPHGKGKKSHFRGVVHTCMAGKPMPTRKFASQLVIPATLTAAGREPWENSSAVMNHGIAPVKAKKSRGSATRLRLVVRLLHCLFVRLFFRSFFRSFLRLFVRSFARSFVCSLVC